MNIMQILVSGLFSAADSYGKGTATFEIIVMLLVAFILGYLLRRFISGDKAEYNDVWEDKYRQLEKQYVLLEKQYDECREKLKVVPSSSLSLVGVPEIEKEIIKEDLKKIEGIGPKIEQLLYEEGIYTWNDLANTEVVEIKIILEKAGPRYKMHDPGTWPDQARLAAQGKWEELEKWQDELKGGREA